MRTYTATCDSCGKAAPLILKFDFYMLPNGWCSIRNKDICDRCIDRLVDDNPHNK